MDVLAGLELDEDFLPRCCTQPQQVQHTQKRQHLLQDHVSQPLAAAPLPRARWAEQPSEPALLAPRPLAEGASVAARIEHVVESILCDLANGRLPRIALPDTQSGSQLRSALDGSQSSQQRRLSQSQPSQLSLSSQLTDRGEFATAVAGEASRSGKSKRAVTLDPSNSQITDRFCRALVLLDAVHVRSRPHVRACLSCKWPRSPGFEFNLDAGNL